MKNFKKIVVFSFIVLCMCGCGKKVEVNEEQKHGEIKQISGNASVNDLEFVLQDSKIESESSEFTFEITNVSNETKYIKEFQAIAKDNDGNDIISLLGVVEQEIPKGEKVIISCIYGGEIQNLKSFQYELIN